MAHASQRSDDLPGNVPAPGITATYEQLLDQDLGWAMTEGSVFFEGRGRVQETLRRITKRLTEFEIPYAVAGGTALYLHGFRRFTEGVDILVTRESLNRVHEELDGRGFVRPFEKSKNLRDAESKVKIEFLLTGGFPGDGKPKPVAFPEPGSVAEIIDGISCVNLQTLVELKLASGMTSTGRMKDLGDVQELIRHLHLPRSLADRLNEYVRPKYVELWNALHASGARFLIYWPLGKVEAKPLTIAELIATCPQPAERLRAMAGDGVEVDPTCQPDDDGVFLFTIDPDAAAKYGLAPADEYFEG